VAAAGRSLYTIGEFSRLTGLTEKALRLYDRRRLLQPAATDDGTGYRYYSPEQVDDGRMVAMLRAIDMPLAEIERVLALSPGQRADAVGRYWYRVERDLDERRTTVRAVRHLAEEKEQGVSNAERAVAAGRSEGAFAAIAQIAEIDDAVAAGEAYAEAQREAYWTARDLSLVAAFAYAGCTRLLTAAHDADTDTAYRLRSSAKAMMYDLASFSWPGWDEEGIVIGDNDAAAGLAAARSNLVMAIDLEKGDLAVSRAHWMLGAHLLTAGEPEGAAEQFTRAGERAEAAGAEAEVALAAAFRALSDLAAGTGSGDALDRAVAELGAADGGEAFWGQVETARRVLGL